jgi:endonuclease/exonuclease/phosphatase family metal-dependent hydrolase
MLWLGATLLVVSVLHAGPPPDPAASANAGRPTDAAKVSRPRASPARAEAQDQGSPFFSRAACEARSPRSLRAAKRGPRIGSWNIRWFPFGTKDGSDPERRTDLRWLACAIASLDVDVLAVQEMVQNPEGRGALLDLLADLDARTSGHWRAELDECPGSGRQHVGFLFDTSRVQVSEVSEVAALNPGRSACDRNLRPGFGLRARFSGGADVELVSVHLDSGITARDFANRRRSVARIADVHAVLRTRAGGPELLVLGDFNSMGCKDCVPSVDAETEISGLDAELAPMEMQRLPLPRGHACTQYQRGRPGVLDHVVAPVQGGLPARVEVYGPCRDLGCMEPPRGQHPEALERLSDHCPLVVELGKS